MTRLYPFVLNKLPYEYSFLEPVIDAETVTLHHDKHHQAYTDNLNKALEANPALQRSDLAELLKSEVGIVKNNAGGLWNHDFYWEEMTKPDAGKMGQAFGEKIVAKFGSVDEFKNQFEAAGLSRFGSGWVWLVVNQTGELDIVSTANQDNPLVEGKKPILGCDVWEHAYYLKYKNRRAEYLKGWWRIVNWEVVEKRWNDSLTG